MQLPFNFGMNDDTNDTIGKLAESISQMAGVVHDGVKITHEIPCVESLIQSVTQGFSISDDQVKFSMSIFAVMLVAIASEGGHYSYTLRMVATLLNTYLVYKYTTTDPLLVAFVTCLNVYLQSYPI